MAEQPMYVESWAQSYGSPYLVKNDDAGSANAELVETPTLECLAPSQLPAEIRTLVFVDGVRRGEASLYQVLDDERVARGIAGSHACGTAIVSPNGPAGFGEMRVHRLVIWGSGAVGELPPAAGGWAWESKSVAADDPTAPLDDLQRRMRNAEGVSAASLCGSDRIVVADGPLDFALRRDRDIVGFVKTHRRALLEPALHARIPRLRPRERTSLFRIGDERFSCYLRLAGCGFKCEESNRTLPGRPSWGSSLPLISRFSFPIEKAPASIRIIVHAE